MNTSEIRSELIANGTRYVLPPRELGFWRLGGLLPLAFGFVFMAIPISVAIAFIAMSPGFFRFLPLLFAIPFILVGFTIARFGLFCLAGRTSIEIHNDHLRSIDRAGPIRQSRKIEFADISELNVARNHRGGSSAISELAALSVSLSSGRKRNIATGYPPSTLDELATIISEATGAAAPTEYGVPPVAFAPSVVHELTDEEGNQPARQPTGDRVPKPASSPITLEDTEDGITITIPPAGRRGAKGMFGFSIIWIGFTLVWLAVTTGISITKSTMISLPFVAFGFIFLLIGIGILLAALNMARRHAIIDVLPDALLISRKGLFGIKQHEWLLADITSIGMEPSGMEVNGVPVMALTIRSPQGGDQTLFSSRTEAELKWLAAELSAHKARVTAG